MQNVAGKSCRHSLSIRHFTINTNFCQFQASVASAKQCCSVTFCLINSLDLLFFYPHRGLERTKICICKMVSLPGARPLMKPLTSAHFFIVISPVQIHQAAQWYPQHYSLPSSPTCYQSTQQAPELATFYHMTADPPAINPSYYKRLFVHDIMQKIHYSNFDKEQALLITIIKFNKKV